MSGTAKKFDLILRGGHVIDPAARRNGIADVAVSDGKIAAVGKGLKGAKRVIDVTGSTVLPGMIDTHAHVYKHVTGRFGLDADMCGVRSGVTTLVDWCHNNPTPDPSNPCPYVMGGLISSSTPPGEKTVRPGSRSSAASSSRTRRGQRRPRYSR